MCVNILQWFVFVFLLPLEDDGLRPTNFDSSWSLQTLRRHQNIAKHSFFQIKLKAKCSRPLLLVDPGPGSYWCLTLCLERGMEKSPGRPAYSCLPVGWVGLVRQRWISRNRCIDRPKYVYTIIYVYRSLNMLFGHVLAHVLVNIEWWNWYVEWSMLVHWVISPFQSILAAPGCTSKKGTPCNCLRHHRSLSRFLFASISYWLHTMITHVLHLRILLTILLLIYCTCFC